MKSAFFQKIRTTNIGKGWPNKNHETGQNQNFLKKENLEKYCPTHFVRTFFKESLWPYEEINKLKYQQLTYDKPNPALKFIYL